MAKYTNQDIDQVDFFNTYVDIFHSAGEAAWIPCDQQQVPNPMSEASGARLIASDEMMSREWKWMIPLYCIRNVSHVIKSTMCSE